MLFLISIPIAFSAPSAASLAPGLSLRTPPVQATLSKMYRERWARDQTHIDDSFFEDSAKYLVPRTMGAFVGVTLAAFAGAAVSESFTDISIAMLNHGSASSSVPLIDATLDLVDVTNAFASKLAVGADALSVVAGFFMLPWILMIIGSQRAASGTATETGELCIIREEDEYCGESSFDSSEDYACVEVMTADGQWRWQCA